MPVQTFDSIEDALRAGVKVPGYELPEPHHGTTPIDDTAPESTRMNWKGLTVPEKAQEFPNLSKIGDQLEVLMRTRTKIANMAGLKGDLKTPMISGHAAAFSLEELQDLLAPIAVKEKLLEIELKRAYRTEVPRAIQEFVEDSKGLGEPSVARFLSQLGHPVYAKPQRPVYMKDEDNPEDENTYQVMEPGESYLRTLSQLRQYCACGKPGHIEKGTKAQAEILSWGKPVLKVYLHRIVSDFTNKGPVAAYRNVFEDGIERAMALGLDEKKTPGAKHSLHSINYALRLCKKEFLRDLWEVSRDTTWL
jgi:hypothetical protein